VKEVDQLKMLGFSPDDCQEALEWNDNNVEEAALWLTQNAHPTDQVWFSTNLIPWQLEMSPVLY